MSHYIVAVALGVLAAAGTAMAAEIHVSPGGSDSNAGTKASPFGSIPRARAEARRLVAAGLKEAVTVVLHAGTHRLTEPLVLDANDSGTTYRSVGSVGSDRAEVVISGGRAIEGWKDAGGGVWSVEVPTVKSGKWGFSELYVNGRRAVRARHPNEGYFRIEKAGPDKRTSFVFRKGDATAWADVANVEVVYLHDWEISRVPVKAVDEANSTITVAQAIGCSDKSHWLIGGFEPHPRYFLENAAEFLDAPGEWHLDAGTGVLRYRPLAGEKLADVQAVAPLVEGPLIVLGGRAGKPVRNVHIRGVSVGHCTYTPAAGRYAGGQACWHASGPAGPGMNMRTPAPAAVEAEFAENCRFEGGGVEHVGGSGIWFGRGCRSCAVVGCRVADVGGNGVMFGAGAKDSTAVGNTLEGSVVERCGARYFGAVGVWVGITDKTRIAHNEIRDLPYTGVSVGWQWNGDPTPCRENVVEYNHIHHVMRTLSDGGGIYTLGRQPGTVLRGNLIHDVPVNAGRAESNGMFLDEGTSELVIEDNVIYNVDRSPLRFHKAFENLVRRNVLVCGKGVPHVMYNVTDAKNIKQEENTVTDAAPEGVVEKAKARVGPKGAGR